MKVLTAAQMREADRLTTERYGVASLQLMENAGGAVAQFLEEEFSPLTGRGIVVLCGKGNNGGDGLVVARLLKQRGYAPRVLLFADPGEVHGDAAINLKRWQQEMDDLQVITTPSQWASARSSLQGAEVVVDALLGTGLRGPVEGLLASVITDLNALGSASPAGRARTWVVSVDTPSGLASDEGAGVRGPSGVVVQADFTVTFTAPKVGQLLSPHCSSCGTLLVREIGTPAELLENDPNLKLHWIEPHEFRLLPLVRKPEAHKGSYGHALIVAGSLGKSGAAVLAAGGALRSGAGLVTVATPLDVLPMVAAGMPEMMTAPLAATEAGTASLRNLDYNRFAEIARDKSVMAMGPGLSTHAETQQFIRQVVEKMDLPIILDADALNAFASESGKLTQRRASALALTPHPGEMARLLGCTTRDVQSRRMEVALEAAARWRAFVILKGFHTIVATPTGHAYVNTTGNPGMATGGTGDVLTGILAGLTAQYGVENWPAVLCLGVYLHGLAGDIAAEEFGQAPLIASDLIGAIPQAWAQILRERGSGL